MQQQILSFSSEGASPSSSTVLHKLDLTNPLLDCATDGRTHTVNTFLERPMNFKTASWSSTDAVATRLASFDFPGDLVNLDMYKRKLERFLALRADLEVRVQVNAQPFHAGRLMLSWSPFMKDLGTDRTWYYSNPAQNFLTSVSGNPRVEIDLSTTTEATMHIPFVSPFLYYNLITGAGNIGTFQLIVYSPLVDLVSGGNINYTMWVRMTNVRTEFPTGMPISVSVAQIGDEGEQQTRQGFVTRQTGAYSTILEPFEDIPLVGSIVSKLKGGVDALHAVAASHGWAKPLNPTNTQAIKNCPTRYMCNADGSDMGVNLALSATNELEQCPDLFRTDVDEMSISYICKTPCYTDRFQWTKASAPASILWSQSVTPLAFFQTVGVTGVHLPLLGYMASHFTFWRGGINLRFKFVKTKFHSGRIRIVYVPGLMADTPPTDFDIDANYSTVVDLRSDTDVDFNIPYVAVVPWLRNKPQFWNRAFNQNEQTGRIFVYVLNELVNTSTVSDSIDVLVEVAGAEDMEFAIPHSSGLVPRAKPASAESASLKLLKKLSIAQVGTEEGDVPIEIVRARSSDFAEVSNQPRSTSFTNSSLTIGEKVSSVRQLIKRFKVLSPKDVSQPWYSVSGGLELQPNYFLGGTLEDVARTDNLSDFSTIFAFYRGSVRFKLFPLGFESNTPTANIIALSTSLYTNLDVVAPIASADLPDGERGAEAMLPGQEGAFEIQCPFYCSYPVALTTLAALDFDVLGARNGFNKTFVRFPTASTINVMVYRAAGDDFSFGFLVGPPVLNHTSA